MTEPGDWLNGRTKLAILMFRMGAVADFLLRGLTKSKNVEGETEYAFPQTGQATETEIGEISKFECHPFSMNSPFGIWTPKSSPANLQPQALSI